MPRGYRIVALRVLPKHERGVRFSLPAPGEIEKPPECIVNDNSGGAGRFVREVPEGLLRQPEVVLVCLEGGDGSLLGGEDASSDRV